MEKFRLILFFAMSTFLYLGLNIAHATEFESFEDLDQTPEEIEVQILLDS